MGFSVGLIVALRDFGVFLIMGKCGTVNDFQNNKDSSTFAELEVKVIHGSIRSKIHVLLFV